MDNSQFFYRTVVFTRKGDQVALVDQQDPNTKIPLEPWLGLVVSLADGQHTIQQLIDYLRSQYPDNAPSGLEATLASAIDRLEKSGVIQLSDQPVTLPFNLAVPEEAQHLAAQTGATEKKPGDIM